ncbi:MAG: ShlB/FhaC/HecB family hemolysin secretion/activation protein [bacterium]
MRTMSAVLVLVAAVCLMSPRIHAQQGVRVQSFQFTGNTVVTAEALSRIVEPYEDKEFTLVGLRAVADSVADYYHKQGYFLAKVVVPEQDISGGNVTLQIFEGKLGEIIVSGNERYSEEFIQKHFARMREEGIIRQDSFERALLLLNDLPGLKATSVLQAGQERGTTDIAINLEEGAQTEGTLEFNNFGSRYSSRVRLSADAKFSNPSQRGDSLLVRAVSGSSPGALFFGSVSYSVPTDANGTRAGMYVMTGDFEVGQEFAVLNIRGKGTSMGLSLTRPIFKTRKKSLTAEIGFDARDSKQELLGMTNSYDRVRALRLGLNRNTEDAKGRTFASLFLHQGLGDMFGGMNNNDPQSSRPGARADGRFTKLTLEAARVHRMSSKSFVIARLSGQVTNRSLVAGEQMAIGGADSVRGYPQSEYLGDNGIQASVEARLASRADQLEKLQYAFFVDWASVSARRPAAGQNKTANLMGIGFGIRANPSKDVSIRADLGIPIGREPSSGGVVIPYLQVIKKF